MRITRTVSLSLLSFALAGSYSYGYCGQADDNAVGLKPGDKIVYDVRLEGVDAKEIKRVDCSLQLIGSLRENQKNLSHSLSVVGEARPDGTFHFELPVVATDAEGDYEAMFTAYTADMGIRVNYLPGELHLRAVHIGNPKTFTPPHIIVTQKP